MNQDVTRFNGFKPWFGFVIVVDRPWGKVESKQRMTFCIGLLFIAHGTQTCELSEAELGCL